MLIQVAIIIAIYLIGCRIAFVMMRTEHEAETKVYTKGHRALAIALSLLSFIMILIILLLAWFGKISGTGYWDQPVKPVEEIKTDAVKPDTE